MTTTQIQHVLNDEDIEGLLGVGAPSDEYESEARMIAKAITEASEAELTEERLIAVVRSTWAEMFGPFADEQLRQWEAAFQRVARRLLVEHAEPREENR